MKKKSFKSRTEKIVYAIIFILFVIYAAYILYPFLFMLNASLKENGRAFLRNTVGISFPMYFSNFLKAFKQLETAENSFIQMTINSIWVAGASTALSIMSSSVAAYVISKYKFRGRQLIYSLVLITMMIPVYGALPSRYRLLSQLGWVDSPLYVISAACGFDFAFLVIYSFFKGISWNYAEAAFMDGATHTGVFFKIMFPMAIPAITAIAITNFISAWNAYDGPLLYLPNMPTLSAGLYAYETKMEHHANQPVYFAGVILSLIPILTLFLVFQNTIMTKIYTGGLKG